MTISNRKMKPVTAAVGAAFVASLTTASIASADDPFAAEELDNGYRQLAQADAEGKCGEGKCGEGSDEEESSGEDENKGEEEGKCGEGKCGEGKCGGAA